MASSLFHKRWSRVLAIVVVVLIAGIAVGSRMLDASLTRKAQAVAATYSQRLGRPIKVERVDTRILTGLGASVSGIEVGPAPGEDLPLAQVPRVEVRIAALRAIFSLGKDIEIRSAEVHRPVVNVIRFADESTNIQKLQKRLAQTQPKQTTPSEPSDLSAIRISHAAITDGRIRLVDRSTSARRELSASDLDVTVNDLRAGRPLDVVLKAALLAQKQNVELRLHTAPLPNTLVPTPERIVLKVQPVDLAPLGPFLPEGAAMEAGRLDADWTAELGAAVPGGSGPTSAEGGIHVRGVRFSGTDAAPLDVALDTDLNGNAETGDVDIRTLSFTAGPAGITGHGRIRGLASETPRIENFEIVGHDLDPAVLARSFPPLRRALKGRVAGPIGLHVRASGTQAAPALAMTLDFTPVRLAIPQQLTKAAGAPMKVEAQLRGAGRNTYRFDTTAQLSGADLRPGMVLDKPPGKTLDLAAQGTVQRGAATHLKVDSWTIHALDDALSGTASVDSDSEGPRKRANTQFQLTARSSHLDADALLLEAPSQPPSHASAAPPDPHRFDGLRANVHAEVENLIFHKVPWRNVVADADVVDDQLNLKRFSLDAVGGQLRGDGTTVRLAPADHPFDLKLSARGLELGQVLTFGGKGKAFAGTFDGAVALTGRGTTATTLEKTLNGTIDGHLKNGTFLGADLVSAVADPLAKVLPFPTNLQQVRQQVGRGAQTPLGNVDLAMTVHDGVARLNKPLVVDTPAAVIDLGGGIDLSGNLDLAGTVALTPSTIESLTGGKVKPPDNIPLALTLRGPAWAPQIAGLDVRPAALALAKLAGGSALQSLLGRSDVARAASGVLSGDTGTGGSAQKPPSEGPPQSESDRLKQQAEDAARKKLQGIFGK
jgi:AsmA protein